MEYGAGDSHDGDGGALAAKILARLGSGWRSGWSNDRRRASEGKINEDGDPPSFGALSGSPGRKVIVIII
jgi:hypothetical protein